MHLGLYTTPGLETFATEIDDERSRQLAKFGDQRHPSGTGLPVYEYAARRYRDQAVRNAAAGVLTWRDVLLEEVYEALAESDPAALRTELVQVAAVCAAWVSHLDRLPAPAPGRAVPAEVPVTTVLHVEVDPEAFKAAIRRAVRRGPVPE
ncbi:MULTISPECIES: hypothetical protein [unclassified Streptomyces]|uniref:hypothetical protein n=1 Tax=unclassified Streptomyces TaxID=2593676 RepID=UPI0036585E3D